MPEPLRVLLVDDHAMMRAGFRMILSAEDDIAVVGEASTGIQALDAARELRPDVICMDVQMPDMDGLEATRRLTDDPECTAAVLIVTTFDRDDYLFQALAAGASGFLLKNAGPEELVRAVRVAAAGDALLSPEVTRRVIARFAAPTPPGASALTSRPPFSSARPQHSAPAPAPTPHSVAGERTSASERTSAGERTSASERTSAFAAPSARPQQSAVRETGAAHNVAGEQTSSGRDAEGDAGATGNGMLTAREREVLALMADALSNAEIAARLFIGEATVKTHVSNVLQKLGARDRVQAIVLAYRLGLA